MTEAELQSDIRIALGRLPDLRVFRNNVGVADVRGTKIRFGLLKGSSDLIGFIRLNIDGRPFARFVSLEIKTETGKCSPEQELWLNLVRKFGGFAAVVRSVDEALSAVERARRGELECRKPSMGDWSKKPEFGTMTGESYVL